MLINVTLRQEFVRHGPAVGDPKAVEDIASPPSMMFRNFRR